MPQPNPFGSPVSEPLLLCSSALLACGLDLCLRCLQEEVCPEVTQLALSFTFGLQTLGIAHSKAFLGMFCPAKDLVPGDGMGVRKAS